MSSSPLLTWFVKHASWLVNRFSNPAPYNVVHGKPWAGVFVHWGETVLGQHAGAMSQGKLESWWSEGVWLGKEPSSNDHVVATETEILYCRTVKAVPDADQKPHLLQRLRLTPWQTTLPGADPAVASRAGRAAMAHTKLGEELETFKSWQSGGTPGCSACQFGAYARAHSKACRDRREEFRRLRGEEAEKANLAAGDGVRRVRGQRHLHLAQGL